jgi:hypothetical protein
MDAWGSSNLEDAALTGDVPRDVDKASCNISSTDCFLPCLDGPADVMVTGSTFCLSPGETNP